MSLPVRTTPEADVQIGAIDDWWRHNRNAAPDLFLQELTASFEVVGVAHAQLCEVRYALQDAVRDARRCSSSFRISVRAVGQLVG